jgi:hypothetical protein
VSWRCRPTSHTRARTAPANRERGRGLGRGATARKRGRFGCLRGRPQRGCSRSARAVAGVPLTSRAACRCAPASWWEELTFAAPDEGAVDRCSAVARVAGTDLRAPGVDPSSIVANSLSPFGPPGNSRAALRLATATPQSRGSCSLSASAAVGYGNRLDWLGSRPASRVSAPAKEKIAGDPDRDRRSAQVCPGLSTEESRSTVSVPSPSTVIAAVSGRQGGSVARSRGVMITPSAGYRIDSCC